MSSGVELATEQTSPVHTAIVPRVVLTPAFPPLSAADPADPPPHRGALRIVLTWAAFGLVAAGVITATTLWSTSLRASPSAQATVGAAGVRAGSTGLTGLTPPASPTPPAPVAAAPPPAAAPQVPAPVVEQRAAPRAVPRRVVPRTVAPRVVVAPVNPVVPAPVQAPVIAPAPVTSSVKPTTTACAAGKVADGSGGCVRKRDTGTTDDWDSDDFDPYDDGYSDQDD